jgi:hypothetical protein
VYNKTVPDDDFIKSKHVVIKTQVFLLVVLTDKIKGIKVLSSCKLALQLFLIVLLMTDGTFIWNF